MPTPTTPPITAPVVHYGTDNLKKMITLACEFTMQINSTATTGWNWSSAFSYLTEIMQIPGVIKSWAAIKQELIDLDKVETQQLYDYFSGQFNIPNDQIKVLIENSLQWTISTIALVDQWKTIKK